MKPSIGEIQVAVAERYSTTVEKMLSSRKVMPRQLAMYIARKYTTKSLPEISRCFLKTHPAVIKGVRDIEKRIMEDCELKSATIEILARLGCEWNDRL